ncbi:MAG TPA: hypothetical protein VGK14_03825 [Novimethylophilus sp.]|jgi:hypothetical protein|uniref:hypothetical protein n=1 Tax=Novimethylophilus sp. TaxID=2137426 RepID=UPI002F401187
MTNPFSAKWTAKGNNLCLGHWEIRYRDQLLSLEAAHCDNDMGTYGIFSYIYPDDEDFAEGLPESDWIIENAQWLADLFAKHDVPFDEAHLRWFYQAVNAHDWRCGSCGGCI